MAARRCPKCNLVNPGTASACDCGWSFVEGGMTAPPRQPARDDQARRDRRARGAVQLILGVLLMFGCIGAVGSIRTAPSNAVPPAGRQAVAVLESAERLGENLVYVIAPIASVILIILGVRNRRG